MGRDQSSFEVINDNGRGYTQTDHQITTKTRTTETERRIIEVSQKHKCKKVGLDAGAGTLGVSVLDHLLETSIKHKIIALNNRSFSLDQDGKQKQKLFKEDMYHNLLSMMEHEELKLLDDLEVKASLRSVQFEFIREEDNLSKMRIFGNDTHITEGLTRAAWLAKKEKTLNLWAY